MSALDKAHNIGKFLSFNDESFLTLSTFSNPNLDPEIINSEMVEGVWALCDGGTFRFIGGEWVAVSGLDNQSSQDFIPQGFVSVIEENFQSVVHGCLVIEGTLQADGKLILEV